MCYEQIPLAKNGCLCPICGMQTQIIRENLWLYSTDKTSKRKVSAKILYCSNCKIPAINNRLKRTIANQNKDYGLRILDVSVGESIESVRCRLYEHLLLNKKEGNSKKVEQLISQKKQKQSQCNIPIVSESKHESYKLKNQPFHINETELAVNTVDVDFSEESQSLLRSIQSAMMLIKIDIKSIGEREYVLTAQPLADIDDECIVMHTDPFGIELITAAFDPERNLEGYYQNKIFTVISVAYLGICSVETKTTEPEKDISTSVMRIDTDFHTSERELLDNLKDKMMKMPDAVALIEISKKHDKKSQYIITTHRHGEEDKSVLSYTELFARELLTAAFRKNRKGKGKFNNCSFKVENVFLAQNYKNQGLNGIAVQKIHIKTGGGMYSCKPRQSAQIVDLLVYAPYTDRYEILRATFEPEIKQCYTDISLFREFVKTYGKPDLEVHFGNTGISGAGWGGLQPESLLKAYGYNVSAQDGFSTRYRQELLAEIVDLNFLSVVQISHLLSFFISAHSGRNYENARNKWEQDKCFIENYKVNPSRFLIVEGT